MNKRQEAKARTRAKLLDAARAEFALRGYTGATVRGIAARAGVSAGAVFNNWESLGDLWREVTDLAVPGAQPPTVDEITARIDYHEYQGTCADACDAVESVEHHDRRAASLRTFRGLLGGGTDDRRLADLGR